MNVTQAQQLRAMAREAASLWGCRNSTFCLLRSRPITPIMNLLVGPSGIKWRSTTTKGMRSMAISATHADPWSEVETSATKMLLGHYERSLDDKGRLTLPSELRAGLGDGAVLTRSFDSCLCIYPARKWDALARTVENLPEARVENRVLARSLFGSAIRCEFDRQGRMVMPSFLREHARLGPDAVILGVYTHVEIWGKETWLSQHQALGSENQLLAEVLSLSCA